MEKIKNEDLNSQQISGETKPNVSAINHTIDSRYKYFAGGIAACSMVGYSIYKIPKLPDHQKGELLKTAALIIAPPILGIRILFKQKNNFEGALGMGMVIIGITSFTYLGVRSFLKYPPKKSIITSLIFVAAIAGGLYAANKNISPFKNVNSNKFDKS